MPVSSLLKYLSSEFLHIKFIIIKKYLRYPLSEKNTIHKANSLT